MNVHEDAWHRPLAYPHPLVYGVEQALHLIPADPELSTKLTAYTTPGVRAMPLGSCTFNQPPVGCPNRAGTVKVTEPTRLPCTPSTPATPLEIMFAVIDVGVGLSDKR